MIKLKLINLSDNMTIEQKQIVETAQSLSPFWDVFIKTSPLAQTSWYNALCGWLVGAYPNKFQLDL